ncbi:V-set and transmembrane domain-containing protein 1 isoform X1 [Erinaceus europaeus]|uniref:V-set and transmembrane domain-containing protein 1 isoform X1 n=1 Tax=Erinaceus europaeus TaxID=9365 RepID=A0ABM3VX53_ERIEU|nr:V-set and transmembrane domain-containing protein 1 isoform X1 [Erinaceus europaeus]
MAAGVLTLLLLETFPQPLSSALPQLVGAPRGNISGEPGGRGPPPAKADTRIVLVVFSCLSLLLLFLAIFFIYRHGQRSSAQEEATNRTSLLDFLYKEETSDAADAGQVSEAEEPPEAAPAPPDSTATSQAASEPPAGVKVEEDS